MTMNVSKREAYFLGIITEEFFGVAEVVFIDSQARNEAAAFGRVIIEVECCSHCAFEGALPLA